MKDKLIKKIEQEKKKTSRLNVNDILAVPIYNYIIYEQMFKDCKHVKLVVSKFEADFMAAKQAEELIQNGVNPADITILSRDTDMFLLNNHVDIQAKWYYVAANTIPDKYKYLYLNGSDFVQQKLSINEFVQIPDKEHYRVQVLREACMKHDLKLLFSDFIFHNYLMFETEVEFDAGFRNLAEAEMAFLMYQ